MSSQTEERQKNADRFSGFAALYNEARPAVPEYPVRVIAEYLGRKPETVVDLGSGTGLSTAVWKTNCTRVIGIEPSADMLTEAKKRADETISFRQGFGNATGLPEGCADAVVCSQSFHWMEPVSTLREVNRILRSGGVFATVDCDWPPVTRWQAERAYMRLYNKVKQLEKTLPAVRDSFVRYSKEKHLENIRSSGFFRYCRELTFANTEPCTAKRLLSLLLSQGSTQAVLHCAPEQLRGELDAFRDGLTALFGGQTFSIDFSYRMRIGVK